MGQETITKILLRRGTDADRQSVVLAAGEPGWTTDTNKLYIGDGSTPGGVEVSAASADLVTGFEHLSANNLYAYTDSDIKVHSDLVITKPGTYNSIEIGKDQTGDNYAFIDLVGDTTYTDYALRLIRGDTGANADSSLIHRGTGSLNINARGAGTIKLKTTNTDRLVVKSDGKVGIGTDAPNHELTVVGDISATGTIHGSSGSGLPVQAYGIIRESGSHTLHNMSVTNPSDGVYNISTSSGLFPNGVCIPLVQSPGARSLDPNTYPPYIAPTVNSVSIDGAFAADIVLWQQAGHFEDPGDEDNMYTFRFFNVGSNMSGTQSIYIAVLGE